MSTRCLTVCPESMQTIGDLCEIARILIRDKTNVEVEKTKKENDIYKPENLDFSNEFLELLDIETYAARMHITTGANLFDIGMIISNGTGNIGSWKNDYEN